MFKKNTAVTGFTFGLVATADGSDITTGTPVGYYTLDGGAQTAIADVTPVHEGNGQWSFDLTAAEMNGDIVGLTFTHASAITQHFTIKTDTKIVSELNDIAATAIVSGGAIDTTGGAVDTVTDVTTKTGYILAATGLDAIVSTALGMVEIAKAIWDRVLTGATHNITNSGGRRLRQIQEAGGYEGGFVWVDTVDGSSGTVPFDNGTITAKCLTFAEALTVAANAALNIKQFSISSDSTITLAATINNKVIVGHGWVLVLNTQNVAGLHVVDAEISGICSGSDWEFHDSQVTNLTADAGTLHNCSIVGTMTLTEAGQYHIHNCHAGDGGTDPIVDTGAAVANTTLLVHGWQGALELQNLGAAGTDVANIAGDGKLTINANCVAGIINLSGNWEVIGAAAYITAGGTINYDDDTSRIIIIEADTADMQPKLGTPAVDISADIADVKVDTASIGVVKNAALSNFEFPMVLTSDHYTAATGLTVTGERSIDGGAFVAVSGSIAEVSDGVYQFDALAADTNGDVITWKFSSATADDTVVTIKTRV